MPMLLHRSCASCSFFEENNRICRITPPPQKMKHFFGAPGGMIGRINFVFIQRNSSCNLKFFYHSLSMGNVVNYLA